MDHDDDDDDDDDYDDAVFMGSSCGGADRPELQSYWESLGAASHQLASSVTSAPRGPDEAPGSTDAERCLSPTSHTRPTHVHARTHTQTHTHGCVCAQTRMCMRTQTHTNTTVMPLTIISNWKFEIQQASSQPPRQNRRISCVYTLTLIEAAFTNLWTHFHKFTFCNLYDVYFVTSWCLLL